MDARHFDKAPRHHRWRHRLQSPFDKNGVASLMDVTPEKDDAVFFWWKTETISRLKNVRKIVAAL